VIGGRRTRKLKGIVMEDPETVLGPKVTLPLPNPHSVSSIYCSVVMVTIVNDVCAPPLCGKLPERVQLITS
jgi:hypothetical protein